MPMLDVNDTNLYYRVKGKGTPIIFIHPPLLTSMNFEYQIEELSREFQVIAFDIRGHGRSGYSSQPITYPLMVEDMKCLLDHLGIQKAFICGYSTGGSIVLEFLLQAADRALGGIVLSGMSEATDPNLRNKISLGVKLAKERTFSLLALAVAWGNSNTTKLFLKLFKEAQKGNVQNIEQYYRYSLDYNCTNQLSDITFPILLIYGKKDKVFYYYAKLLKEKLPDSELKFIDGVSHQVPTKAAVDVNDLIRRFVHVHTNLNKEDLFFS